MASFLPFKIYSERQTRKRKTESCLLSLLSTRLSLPSARFSFPTQPPFPSEMPSVSYLPSAAPSTKFYHFFPSWFRMPQHHFNLFLWALVFNLFPNLISDPSSLKWKKKKKNGQTRLHNLTIPSGWGIKMIREDSPVLLIRNALGLPWWKRFFPLTKDSASTYAKTSSSMPYIFKTIVETVCKLWYMERA